MAKGKTKGKAPKSPTSPKTEAKSYRNLSDLREDKDTWYKIRLLIYDLRTMAKDKTSENRLSQTTDALYLSGPYFTAGEAAAIKAVDVDGSSQEKTITERSERSERSENFFEKRKASGHWRPCGPHDLAPVYVEVFGVGREEVEEEGFFGRVRRSGLK